jgi:hypothetical protein
MRLRFRFHRTYPDFAISLRALWTAETIPLKATCIVVWCTMMDCASSSSALCTVVLESGALLRILPLSFGSVLTRLGDRLSGGMDDDDDDDSDSDRSTRAGFDATRARFERPDGPGSALTRAAPRPTFAAKSHLVFSRRQLSHALPGGPTHAIPLPTHR